MARRAAEKQKDHDYHQREGNEQCHCDIADRIDHESGGVVIHQVFEARRKAPTQVFQVLPDQGSGLDRIGAGSKTDADSDRRLAVDAPFDVLILRAKLDAGDITDTQQRAVGIGTQDDVAELLGSAQTPLRLHVHLELLIIADRAGADPADRRLHVLRLDGADIGRRQHRLSSRLVSNQIRIE